MQQLAGSCALPVVVQVRTRYQVCSELALRLASFLDNIHAGSAQASALSASCIEPPCGHACRTPGRREQCKASGCSGWWLKDNASWDRAHLALDVGSCLLPHICVAEVDIVVQVGTAVLAESPRLL